MFARVPLPLEEYPEVHRASEAISLLEQYRLREEPFCLRLDFFGPHYPHYLPEPYISMYDPSTISPWPNFQDPLEHVHFGTEWLKNRWRTPDPSWETYAALVAAYYGHITCLDEQMGRVLDFLEESGQSQNTIVIFTSDHGDMTGGHGLLQKGAVVYDELYRIPMIVRWPEVAKADSRCDELIHLFDIMPTLLEISGIEVPGGLDARSFAPVLRGNPHPNGWREIFAEYLAEQQGDDQLKLLRTRSHKFSINTTGPNELFDLDRDPGELRNVIDDLPANYESNPF